MKRSVWTMMMAGCVALLAACNEAPTEVVPAEMELQQARALWEARGADDYTMTVRLGGAWIGGSAQVWVQDGEPVWVRPLAPEGVTASTFREHDTIEELFAILQRAVENDSDRIIATFHSRLGVPLSVAIDQDVGSIDDEHGFVVESFELR